MKSPYIAALVLLLSSEIVYGNPKSFAEFQQVPAEKRTALAHDLNEPMHDQFVRWSWRMHMGEEAWKVRQQNRLIYRYNREALLSLFEYYVHVREEFIDGKLTKVLADDPPSRNAAQEVQLKRDLDAARSQYEEAVRTLSTLAPTLEAQALNKEASTILDRWIEAYPMGKNGNLNSKAMDAITKSYLEVLTQMNICSKLSPDEIRKAVDTLPADGPQRGEIF